MKSRAFVVMLMTSSGLVGIANHALAQDVQSDGKSVEEVVVTGSRISNGFQAPTPVTVLSAESLEQAAAPSIPEALRELPALIKSASPRQAPVNASADPNSSAGTYLNLRNLGNQRNLLLQDGLRVPPNRSDGRTDANLIPQLLVQRVEVVTGGASAAYGSDAVSGVVNYIMDNRFQGIKGVIQGGSSERGDMRNYKVGLAFGQSFLDDKLHVVASAEHFQDGGISNACRREWGCDYYQFGGVNGAANAGTVNNPYTAYAGSRFAVNTADGYIKTVFNANGSANTAANAAIAGRSLVYQTGGAVLKPYNPGTLIAAGVCVNCDGSVENSSTITLVPYQNNDQAYTHVEYDISPNLTVWGQGSYARTHVAENLLPEYFLGSASTTLTIFSGNAYLSPAVQAVLTSTGADNFQLDTIRDAARGDLGNLTHDSEASTKNFQIGFKGSFGDGWNWKLWGVDAKSNLKASGKQSENAKLYAALDAVRDASGNIVCRVTITNPGLYPGCAPLNLFGVGSPSAAAKAYIQGTYHANQSTTLKGWGAEITGRPFEVPAGPVAVAAGVEFREQALKVTSDANDFQTTGVRYGTGNQLRFRANNIQPITGSIEVKEVFGEVEVPLLKDLAAGGLSLVKELNLNVAGRLTDYSISGQVKTWKAGLSWAVNDDIRFRTTRSRDIRAPTLNDFFQPDTTTFGNFTDIHTGNSFGVVPTVSSGNKSLKPEIADTFTVGVIYSPSFVSGFTTSVDYYNINMKNAIQSFAGNTLVTQCENSGGTSPLCAGVVRPFPFSNRTPANYPTLLRAQSFNALQSITAGIDAEASYRHELYGGTLTMRLLGTYQGKAKSQSSPTNPLLNGAGHNSNPKLQVIASVGYDYGNFGVDVRTRRIGKWTLNTNPAATGTVNHFVDPIVDAVYYTDLGFTYNLEAWKAKRMQLFFSIGNLFDQDPPLIPQLGNPGLVYPTERTLYDIIGRDYTAGIRFAF